MSDFLARHKLLGALAIAAAALLVIVIVTEGDGDGRSPETFLGLPIVDRSVKFSDASRHDPPSAATPYQMPCTDIDEPPNFPYFSLGPRFRGLPVRSVLRDCRGGGTANYVSPNDVGYIYGWCKPVSDTGCRAPLSIQSYPACQRNLSDYEVAPNTPAPRPRLVRWKGGALSGSFSGGTSAEVYTGTSTIVFFGNDPDLLAGALGYLRREPPDRPPGVPAREPAGPIGVDALPPPARGALNGKIRCPTAE